MQNAKINWIVMRHAEFTSEGKETNASLMKLYSNTVELRRVIGKRMVILYHSETQRAKDTARLLRYALEAYGIEAKVAGELDELNSTDPLLRHAIKRPVAENTFAVYVSHEPVIEMVFKVKGVPYCSMYGEGGFCIK